MTTRPTAWPSAATWEAAGVEFIDENAWRPRCAPAESALAQASTAKSARQTETRT